MLHLKWILSEKAGLFMQKTKLNGRFWLALTVFSLVGQVAWVV